MIIFNLLRRLIVFSGALIAGIKGFLGQSFFSMAENGGAVIAADAPEKTMHAEEGAFNHSIAVEVRGNEAQLVVAGDWSGRPLDVQIQARRTGGDSVVERTCGMPAHGKAAAAESLRTARPRLRNPCARRVADGLRASVCVDALLALA
ncbi:hypothetical protein Salat_1158000 [Sesamum alatum]|uniref:Uncharacterized protein n=1 Tax=Sesamum alatum TaxID=300844 RepID=A0AAE2CNE6_9LAMI|nr:hypothetical protein Salat_1158000 [Sesamum alatum]